MTQKTLLVLAAGPLQLPAIHAARRMGLRVVAADGDPSAPGLALADAAHIFDIRDPAACLAIARQEKIHGAIQICCEASLFAMGRINDTLGLSGLCEEAARRSLNKDQMRGTLAEAGVAVPAFVTGRGLCEAEVTEAAESVGYPLVVKPTRSSGSRGVTRVDAPGEGLLRAYRRAVEESADGEAMLEQYVDGREFSLEVVTWGDEARVLAVTDKVTTGAPNFVETGHSQPTRESPADRAALEDEVIRATRALGIRWSTVHAEARMSESGPVIMEMGPRLGGDYITTELTPRSTGVDMVEAAVSLALGQEPDLEPRRTPRCAAIRYLCQEPGLVTGVRGAEAAAALPDVKIVEVYYKVGDTLPPVLNSLSRHGHVIAEGDTVEQAIANAEAARDVIRYTVE